jgi:hypothetical protein
MIDPETLDAATLNERLSNLRIIEEIEAIQRRRSSLSLGQLAHPDAGNDPFYESQDLLRELAKSSRLMAHSQSKTVEKETNDNSKLKGLDTTDIIQFLATFNRKSCQPVYYQVPVPLRRGLVMTLGLPAGSTLESFYGEGLGPDVAFVRDLYQLVGSRTDVKPKEVLRAHCMSDVSTLNRTALMDMLAVCQEVVIAHIQLFDDFSLAECKEVVVSNIRPLSFRILITEYASRYMNPLFTFDDLVRLIVKEFDAEMFANNRMRAHGVTSLANTAQISKPPQNSASATTTTLTSAPKVIICFNCQQPGHSATVCTTLCRFHNLHCANKFACYRRNTEAKKPKAPKKVNVTVASDTTVSVAQCPTSYTADSQFTPYPLSNPDVGIVDTG